LALKTTVRDQAAINATLQKRVATLTKSLRVPSADAGSDAVPSSKKGKRTRDESETESDSSDGDSDSDLASDTGADDSDDVAPPRKSKSKATGKKKATGGDEPIGSLPNAKFKVTTPQRLSSNHGATFKLLMTRRLTGVPQTELTIDPQLITPHKLTRAS